MLPIASGDDAPASAAPSHESRTARLDRDHPFSAPRWYPLRHSELRSVHLPNESGKSSLVGCVYNVAPGCRDHIRGIDFIADVGDDVFAAGSGRLHIVNAGARGCAADGRVRRPWAWIDHGGGVVSRYHHLQGVVLSKDGELVTPRNKIGEISLGGRCGNTVSYLHFEIRKNGLHGSRVFVKPLNACRYTTGAKILLPRAVGYQEWADVPWREVMLLRARSSCVGRPYAGTPDRPRLSAGFGNQKARLSWNGPSRSVEATVVEMRLFHPTTGKWGAAEYRHRGPSARSMIIDGLSNGRWYRFRVAYKNSAGYSQWSTDRVVVPAGLPSVPQFRNATVTGVRIGYGWYRSDGNGRSISKYHLAIRRRTSSGWRDWRYVRVGGTVGWYNFEGVSYGRTYAIKVRAFTAAGRSAWSPSRSFTTGSG